MSPPDENNLPYLGALQLWAMISCYGVVRADEVVRKREGLDGARRWVAFSGLFVPQMWVVFAHVFRSRDGVPPWHWRRRPKGDPPRGSTFWRVVYGLLAAIGYTFALALSFSLLWDGLSLLAGG